SKPKTTQKFAFRNSRDSSIPIATKCQKGPPFKGFRRLAVRYNCRVAACAILSYLNTETPMSPTTQDDLGKLTLRLTIGILLLFPGIAKLTGGSGGIESMVVAKGLPGCIAWGAYIGDLIAPILLINGTYARLGALLIVI